jgi:hypothetical protein
MAITKPTDSVPPTNFLPGGPPSTGRFYYTKFCEDCGNLGKIAE